MRTAETEAEFVVYPELYELIKGWLDIGNTLEVFGEDAAYRFVEMVSLWDAAVGTYGDAVSKVVGYRHDNELCFNAYDEDGECIGLWLTELSPRNHCGLILPAISRS